MKSMCFPHFTIRYSILPNKVDNLYSPGNRNGDDDISLYFGILTSKVLNLILNHRCLWF